MDDPPWIGVHPLDYEESLEPVEVDIDMEIKTIKESTQKENQKYEQGTD